MRIAIYHNLPSGGGKRTLYEQVKRLSVAHEIDVYTLSIASHDFGDLRPLVKNHRIYPFQPLPLFASPFGRGNPLIRTLDLQRLDRITRKIGHQIDADGYDLTLVHPCLYEVSSSLLYHLRPRPSVYYCQEPLRRLYEEMPWRPYYGEELKHRIFLNRFDPLPGLYRRTLRNNDRRNTTSASVVLVNSEFSRNNVAGIYGVDAKVSYHGIDTQFFQPMHKVKEHFVLSVGSLTPLKGFDFLIQVMAELPVQNRPRLVIASNFQNPSERQYLDQLASELRVDVEFLGNVTDEKLLELYNLAKLTLYAPVREPFGLVPLESLACATPVVVVSEGGIQETILDGVDGFMIERDAKKFAQAVNRLLCDPSMMEQFGNNGREQVVNNWSWERSIEVLQNHLSECAKSGRKSLVV